jgi:hypothetical protein
VKVARKGGLRYLEAAPSQLAAQLVLVGDQGTGDQVPYRIVPLKLHCLLLKTESAARRVAAAHE